MKKEVEILFELKETIISAKNKLSSLHDMGSEEVIDTYFVDPKRRTLQPRYDGRLASCLRVRLKGDRKTLTYKDDHFDEDKWLYSDEYEIGISDGKAMQNILEKLGLEKLVEVNTTKHIFTDDKFEIVLEEVKGLGNFIEVEYRFVEDDANVHEAKNYIRKWLKTKSIATGPEMNAGKPELMLQRTK